MCPSLVGLYSVYIVFKGDVMCFEVLLFIIPKIHDKCPIYSVQFGTFGEKERQTNNRKEMNVKCARSLDVPTISFCY